MASGSSSTRRSRRFPPSATCCAHACLIRHTRVAVNVHPRTRFFRAARNEGTMRPFCRAGRECHLRRPSGLELHPKWECRMSVELKGPSLEGFEIVAYGGRDNELNPSRGTVYLTQTGRALHHRPDCMYVFGGRGTVTRGLAHHAAGAVRAWCIRLQGLGRPG
jgi:hypothetical protein